MHFLSRETCDASYIRFGKTKDKHFNRSLRHGTEMRHRNLRSDSVRYIPVTYGAFPLHGTVRFGTAQYGTVQLSSGRFAFPP